MRFILSLLLSVVISPLSWGADFKTGLAAAKDGDFATALREWTPLAEQGHAAAQFNLGLMYDYGRGVTVDPKTAANYFLAAAKQGHQRAQHVVGIFFSEGRGVQKNLIYAHMWLSIAIYDNYSRQGLSYDDEKDATKLRRTLEKNMNKDWIDAAYLLGNRCYHQNYKDCE